MVSSEKDKVSACIWTKYTILEVVLVISRRVCRSRGMTMNGKILVRDEKYEGKYVAFKSTFDLTVVSYGDNPKEVFDDAKSKGSDVPLLMFVPEHGISCCY